MTAKEYTDWWGEAEVVSLNRTQYMGIVADLAAAEEREEWWKNVAATADKHRKDLMAERDELKESLHESNMQCARLNDMVAGLTRTVDDTVQELSEANRQIDALAAEKRELTAELADYRAYYDFVKAFWQPDKEADETWALIARIEARRAK